MRTSTIYFIGSFLMFLMFLSNMIWNDENSAVVLSFLDGIAVGWGVVSGMLMRYQGD